MGWFKLQLHHPRPNVVRTIHRKPFWQATCECLFRTGVVFELYSTESEEISTPAYRWSSQLVIRMPLFSGHEIIWLGVRQRGVAVVNLIGFEIPVEE